MARIIKIWCKYSAKNQKDENIELTAETQIDDGEQPYKVAQDVIKWLKATVHVELGNNVSEEIHSVSGVPEQNIQSIEKAQEKIKPETKSEINTNTKPSNKWGQKLEQNIK